MIRLIATDMDGTLFDAPLHVPPETFELIRELKREGIHFCASSGRRFGELIDVFKPVINDMDFVASNGAECIIEGKRIDWEIYSHQGILELAELVNRFDKMHLLVHTDDLTYCLDDSPEKYARLTHLSYKHIVNAVPDTEVPIYNGVVMCDAQDIALDMVYVLSLEMGDVFTFAWTGKRGIDFMPRRVSKSQGIKKVMRHYGINPSEVIAYGDSMNDYDILRFVGHPVVMENGLYGVKQIAERIIGTDQEHAVQKDMARLLAEIREGTCA